MVVTETGQVFSGLASPKGRSQGMYDTNFLRAQKCTVALFLWFALSVGANRASGQTNVSQKTEFYANAFANSVFQGTSSGQPVFGSSPTIQPVNGQVTYTATDPNSGTYATSTVLLNASEAESGNGIASGSFSANSSISSYTPGGGVNDGGGAASAYYQEDITSTLPVTINYQLTWSSPPDYASPLNNYLVLDEFNANEPETVQSFYLNSSGTIVLPSGSSVDIIAFCAPDLENYGVNSGVVNPNVAETGSIQLSWYSGSPSSTPSSVSWAQPQNGNWSTASNWSPATVPTSAIDADFNTGSAAPYTVTLGQNESVNNFNVQGDNVGLSPAGNTLSIGGALNIGPNSSGTPGRLTINSGGTGGVDVSVKNGVNIAAGGTLSGNAIVAGNVSNAGAVSPGTSTTPGSLYIAGNYAQQSTGTLNIRVNGMSASESFDSLQVTGNAALNGTLYVSLGNTAGSDFIPSSTDSYQILASNGTLTGTFSNVKHLVGAYSSSNTTKLDGVFSVNYDTTGATSTNGVSLSNFRQTSPVDFFGVGVNWSNVPPIPNENGIPEPVDAVRGDQGAASLESCLQSNLPNFNVGYLANTPNYSGINANLTSATNNATISSAFSEVFAPSVGAHDTVVFYVDTHGNSTEVATSSDLGGLTAQTIAGDLNELPTTTQKIVILESCGSGALGTQLTSMVPNIAVLSSAQGNLDSDVDPATGIGLFTEALETEIDNGTFNLNQINNDIAYSGYYSNLYGQTLDLEGSGTGVFGGLQPQLSESSDFQGDFLGPTAALPEPGNIGLLGLGGILLLSRRTRALRRA
jgi:hypothetical protein